MTDINAFPIKEPTTADFTGMSLHDYFAAKAMQGWVSDSTMRDTDDSINNAATFAYRMADAMMKARKE